QPAHDPLADVGDAQRGQGRPDDRHRLDGVLDRDHAVTCRCWLCRPWPSTHTLKPRSWPSRPIRSSIACSCCQGFGSVARKSATSSGVLKSSTTLLLCRCPDPFACDELGVGALFIWALGCRPRRAVLPQHDPRAAAHRSSLVRPPVRQPKTRRQTRVRTPPTT